MSRGQSFEKRVEAGWPSDWQSLGIVLAVSGGADSVALLRAAAHLRESSPGLVVAHFNHQLRGAESQADQEFVAELCERLGLVCRIGQRPVSSPSLASEQAARDARYGFLERTANESGARYVATAHTADDQAETVLHHILRGTGLVGIAGMARVRPLGPAASLVRPMLELTRDDVLAYLGALEQRFRQDRTNQDTTFTRNRIRHELLPLLKRDYSASVVESLVRLGTLASDAQHVIDAAANRLMERSLTVIDERRVNVDCRQLAGEDRHLIRETLLAAWRRQGWPLGAMGFVEWNLLADMVQQTNDPRAPEQRVFPGAILVRRQGHDLVLQAAPD
jgi:tRNA(Ile)-lysidine synthase